MLSKIGGGAHSDIYDAPPPALFSCKNISKSYDGKHILSNITLNLYAQDFVSIVGASGVGKTTLFNILAGVEPPDSGDVFLHGARVTGSAGAVSYMPQKDLLFEYLTVLDNITLPLIIQKQKRTAARAHALSFFAQFGLEGYADKYPAWLSGGMRQRAALLRAIMLKKPVMLLDEPFSALDAITRAGMRDWYEKVVDELRISTLCITHDIDEALLLSRRVYVMAGRPAVLRAAFTIDAPRPRPKDFFMSPQCARLKQDIFAALS